VRQWFPRTIAGQLVTLLLAALILSQAITVVLFFGERDQAVREAWQEEFFARVALVSRLVEANPTLAASVTSAVSSRWQHYRVRDEKSPSSAPMNENDLELATKLSAYLDGPQSDGVRLRASQQVRASPSLWRWFEGAIDALFGGTGDEELDKEPFLVIDVPLKDGRWLNVELPVRDRSVPWALLPVASAALMGIAILIIVAVLVRNITKPLRKLAVAADSLGRGQSLPPLEVSGPDEIRRVTIAFNTMGERLTRFLADRTRMLAAISHDLRTPITAARVRAEFIDDDETRQGIVSALEEMKTMTEATLSFARDEAVEEPSRMVDLCALIESITDDQADLGRPVTFEASGPLPFRCRPASMKRAITNLVENAVRYGGFAQVRVSKGADNVTVVVEDNGPGIPEDKLSEVFAPFVRLETSRSRETGGVGLGLAIVRSVVLAHGGTITLSNRSEGGLRAVIVLPHQAA
jgi:signal transduction histidine kinase